MTKKQPPTDHDAELALFIAGEPVDIGNVLRTLPSTATTSLAVAAVLRLIDHPNWLATSCSRLPVAVIRGVLDAMVPGHNHLFLRLAVFTEAKAADVKAAWTRAIGALHDLASTEEWDTPARRETLAALAGDPLVLYAVQGLVAHVAEVTLGMLAVLAIDGSDASVDALIPHLDPALGEGDARLEKLAMLRSCVKRTPVLDALFVELDAGLAARRSTSPALALGPVIGVGHHDVLWFRFMLLSSERNGLNVPKVQGNVRIDSRDDPWFSVWVSTVAGSHDRDGDRTTRFDERSIALDQLELGRCEPAELPLWLARVADQLEIQWQRFVPQSNLPAAHGRELSSWLIVSPTKRR